MYAPKFRSWLTDWERFEEARDYVLDAWEAEVKGELATMAAHAIESVEAMLPVKPKAVARDPAFNDLSAMLRQYGNSLQPMSPLVSYQQQGQLGRAFEGLGGFFGCAAYPFWRY